MERQDPLAAPEGPAYIKRKIPNWLSDFAKDYHFVLASLRRPLSEFSGQSRVELAAWLAAAIDIALFLLLAALPLPAEAGRLTGRLLGRIAIISAVLVWGVFGRSLKRWRRARLLAFASLVLLAQLAIIVICII